MPQVLYLTRFYVFVEYCGEIKPIKPKSHKCVDCRKEDSRRWSRTEHAKAIWRKYAKTPKGLASQERRTLRKHNITPERYYELLKSQNNGCAICGSLVAYSKATKRKFAIDHDHACCPTDKSCGKCIRGLLCSHCNIALERLESIPEWAVKAVGYLESFRKKAA